MMMLVLLRVRFILSWQKASSDLCKHSKVYKKPVQCTSDSDGDDDRDDVSNSKHEMYVVEYTMPTL